MAITLAGAPVTAHANILDPSEAAESTQLLLGIPHGANERLAGIGTPMELEASNGGVTVTLDRVVGDRTLIICVFSVVRNDGSPFVTPVRPGMTSAPMITFGSADAKVNSWDLFLANFPGSMLEILPRANIVYGSYDANPDDAAFQFISALLSPWPLWPSRGRVPRLTATCLVECWKYFDGLANQGSLPLPATTRTSSEMRYLI